MTWLRREDLEDRELRELCRFAARSRDARRRLAEPPDALRTAFQRDRDRVIHSRAFRRMQHKTQVVAAWEGDHYRSRMVHSLEVSQMSRSVARALALNADLAEAVALAHDLGHPPFGHVGEDALDELMRAHGGFRHNAQGLRIVDALEPRYGHGHGLNLTDPTRLSLLKGKVPDGFPLPDDLHPPRPAPPAEAKVVDLCDKIAYLCHDLDDGLRLGVFEVGDAAELRLWRRAQGRRRHDGVPATLSTMISLLIHDLVQTTDELWSAVGSVHPEVRHGDEMIVESQELLAFLRDRFYRSRRVLSVMEAGQERIRRAFERFVAHPAELPERLQARIDADGLERVVCDYVSGMTDRFLAQLT